MLSPEAFAEATSPLGRAREAMRRRWYEQMNGIDPESLKFTLGMLAGFEYVGIFDQTEADAWKHRLASCPEGPGNHTGGRSWCAYCGEIHHCEQCGIEIPHASMRSITYLGFWLCSLDCREAYRQAIRSECRRCGAVIETPRDLAPDDSRNYGYCSRNCATLDAGMLYGKPQ